MAELFSGPLMSIALVILAGIALRYALWMGRERGADTGDTSIDFEQRSRELTAALERSETKQRELRAQNERISEDYQSLRAALDARDAAIAEAGNPDLDIDEITAEWRRKVQQKEEARTESEARLADAMDRLSAADGRSQALVDQLDELRERLRQQEEDRHGLLVERDELHDSHVGIIEQRDRLAAQWDELTDERDQLMAERDQLTTERDRLSVACDQLTIERDRLSTERDQLVVEHDQLTAERDQLSIERDQLVIERDEMRRQRVELEQTAEIMAEQRRALAEERDELTRKIESESVKVASAETLRIQADDKQAHLRSDLEAANQRYESALNECTELQKALHEAEIKIAELANRQLSESVETSQQLRAVESANRDLTNELSAMESKLSEATEELEQTRQAVARMQSEVRFVGQLRNERARLLSDVEKLQKLTETIRQEHTSEQEALVAAHAEELQQLSAELASSRQSMRQQATIEQEFQGQLMARDEQLKAAMDAQSELEQSLKETTKTLSRHDEIVGQLDDQMQNLQTEKDELTLGLRREKEVVRQLSEELEGVRKQARKMELEVSHLDLLRQDHQCVSEELTQMTAQIGDLRRERDELADAMESSRRELMDVGGNANRIEQDLAAQKAMCGELREDNERLQIELAQQRTEKATLEKLLEVHSETLQRLRADSMSIETLLERQAAVQESLQEHADRLRSVALDTSTKSTTFAPPTLDTRPLRPEEAAEIISFHESPPTADLGRIDSILGLVYDQPPKHPDDLKRITGVGVVLEQRLNRLGIYRYEQLMNLTETAVVELSKLLAFKDRIDRDDWIGQARRLFMSSGSRVA